MQITAIIGDWTYSKPFADVADELNTRFKGQVEMVTHCCVRHQSFSQKLREEMDNDVRNSNIVLVCMVFDEAVVEILERHASEEKTYIILASGEQAMKLARIGKFF